MSENQAPTSVSRYSPKKQDRQHQGPLLKLLTCFFFPSALNTSLDFFRLFSLLDLALVVSLLYLYYNMVFLSALQGPALPKSHNVQEQSERTLSPEQASDSPVILCLLLQE